MSNRKRKVASLVRPSPIELPLSVLPRRSTKLAHAGEIHLICGPMFSEKTTELIRRTRRYRRKALKDQHIVVCLIKYAQDNRYTSTSSIVTHDGDTEICTIKANTLAEVKERVKNANVISLDEGQFYPDLAEYCVQWAREDKFVIVAALDADAKQRIWESVGKLIPFCTQITKMTAVCDCGGDAPLTFAHEYVTPLVDGEKRIGGSNIYYVACLTCSKKSLAK